MALPSLATLADSVTYGYSLPADSATTLLARASVRIRRAAGQPITPSTVTVQLPVHSICLELPAPPVISVTDVQAVASDGTTSALTGWWWDGVHLRLADDCDITRVQVTYERGWDTLPDGIVELTCQVANRLANTPVGMDAGIRERAIDDFRETYAAESVQAAGDLLPGELTALQRDLGERCVWVVGL
ncbi:hypothetical protein ACL02U_09605 [Streptomyces sp. MS06]|uniref:hypothetical protein n=1 Tax=Streptomyces sp. MS06 TaxID=3385974 RepID=UPI0039A36F4A